MRTVRSTMTEMLLQLASLRSQLMRRVVSQPSHSHVDVLTPRILSWTHFSNS